MLKNVFSNWMLLAVTALSMFAILPFNISHLGKEQYGVWLIIVSITGIVPLLYNGVPMTLERFVAQAVARGDRDGISRLMSTGMVIMMGITALAISVATVVYFSVSATKLGGFDQSVDARFALLLGFANAVVFVGPVLPHVVLAANQQFVISNVIGLIVLLVRLGLNVAFILWEQSVTSLASAFLAATVFETIALFVVVFWLHPGIRLRLSLFSRDVVRQIFRLAAWTFILTLGWQLCFQVDALVIGAYLGKGDVTVFGVANALMLHLLSLMVGVASVAMPVSSALHAKGDFDQLRSFYLKWTKISVALSSAATAFLFVFGGDFLSLWLGADIGRPAEQVLAILLVSYVLFLPVRAMSLPLLVGVGQAGWATLSVVLIGLFNLGLSIALVGPLGIAGVALGTTVPNLILAFVFMSLSCGVLGISLWSFLREAFGRAVFGLAVVVAALAGIRYVLPPQTFVELFVVGVASLLVIAVVWAGYVLKGDRHVDMVELGSLFANNLKRRFC